MIRRICMVCGIEHSPPIEDGQPEVHYSHGYCQPHFKAAMAQQNSQSAALPAVRLHPEAV